jgi:phosphoribosylglycinamide formyltransferase-1|tara:strand:+ start:17488 stop:18078 length:591 start_codon:yes stop_codon:yes gene_type:complete
MQYSNKQKLAIFASGAGSNAQQLFDYFKEIDNVAIELVVCNRKSAGVIEKAQHENIDVEYLPKAVIYESNKLEQLLKDRKIDFIVLSGFLLKIPTSITKLYENRILNIHPSLLPKFGGAGMYGMNVHDAVKASGETESGISIHIVNEVFDDGEIIFQAKCPIDKNDTSESIQKKVQILEHQHFATVVHQYIKNYGI